jgi:dolichol-phosphate mannosyltransferase
VSRSEEVIGKVLVSVLTYNEEEKLRRLLGQFPDQANYDLLIVDDGSTDGTATLLENQPHILIHHEKNLGVGAGIKSAVDFARSHDYAVIVIMAGNGKMLPSEIPRLLEPIMSDRADYVQGSRYLKGGSSPNLPLFRHLAIKAFTLIVSAFLGFRGTDITCGFRAYRLDIFDDPRMNIDQDWLGRYEMEYYIHYRVARGGKRMVEVPVSMVYPSDGKNYSKIKPFVGWWSMIRPWVFLALRIKR